MSARDVSSKRDNHFSAGQSIYEESWMEAIFVVFEEKHAIRKLSCYFKISMLYV